MAEPLKNHFGPAVVRRLAASLRSVERTFDARGFERAALRGFDDLELMPRGRHLATVLADFLPRDFDAAAKILVASLGPKLEATEGNGMAPFFYLPHVLFVAARGLDHFDTAMNAHYELTQRFTAEFGIRPFIERHTARSLKLFRTWARDESVHVRRLVSEGTRPRLPWAARLRCFERDPTPTLELLERLRDDPEEYVRRSVANHLNDIGKDHPAILVEVAREWLRNAPTSRERLVRHALRTLVKQGDRDAIGLLGYGGESTLVVNDATILPSRARRGDHVTISFRLANREDRPQRALVDLRIHFVKANGATSPKVFKLAELELGPNEGRIVSKKISLADLSTRKHYPGMHRVEVQLNGERRPLGTFELQ